MNLQEFKQIPLPDVSGVYIFRNSHGKELYIGKATSLRDRVKSYFSADLVQTRGVNLVAMVQEAVKIDWLTTDSVLEALILEANLIKKHQPQYNSAEKGNTSFNYLVITKEEYPRVLVVRGRELFQDWKESAIKYLFGPFPHGASLKEAIKLVRKIFPYRDTCMPGIGRPCFNAQIGLCPGVCAGLSVAEYKKTIRNIVELFSGKMPSLRKRLEKEMRIASKVQQFEQAEMLRRQVHALTHIRDVSLIKDEYRVSPGGAVRIEAYDVAHTAGSETVGVMTVVAGGEALKAEYRKFKIRTVTNNDVAALAETLERRLGHPEWTLPRVIVVDGSSAQLRRATKILDTVGVKIPIVGVVKDEFHRPQRLIGDTKAIAAFEKDILLANAEAHRYAIGWHRARQRKGLTR
jgi:excinuclease ABC subunit C